MRVNRSLGSPKLVDLAGAPARVRLGVDVHRLDQPVLEVRRDEHIPLCRSELADDPDEVRALRAAVAALREQ